MLNAWCCMFLFSAFFSLSHFYFYFNFMTAAIILSLSFYYGTHKFRCRLASSNGFFFSSLVWSTFLWYSSFTFYNSLLKHNKLFISSCWYGWPHPPLEWKLQVARSNRPWEKCERRTNVRHNNVLRTKKNASSDHSSAKYWRLFVDI